MHQPKDIVMAIVSEKIAVRMEANITADKQRTRFVEKVDDQNKGSQNQTTEQQMENISKRIDMLSKSVQNLTQQQRPRMPANARNFPPEISTISQDQTDLITEICLFKEIISQWEVIHISTNQIMVIYKLKEIKLDRRETFASQLRGPQPG